MYLHRCSLFKIRTRGRGDSTHLHSRLPAKVWASVTEWFCKRVAWLQVSCFIVIICHKGLGFAQGISTTPFVAPNLQGSLQTRNLRRLSAARDKGRMPINSLLIVQWESLFFLRSSPVVKWWYPLEDNGIQCWEVPRALWGEMKPPRSHEWDLSDTSPSATNVTLLEDAQMNWYGSDNVRHKRYQILERQVLSVLSLITWLPGRCSDH